jgi:HEAT repeat protein
MKTILLNHLLLVGLLTLSASGLRADEEQDLIATLQSAAGVPQKCAACQRLRVVGTVKSVPVLASFLGEDRTSHAARYALEGMPYPEALAVLREALGKTSGPTKAGLVDSLGWRRDLAALPLLTPLLSDPDAAMAAAAASALGRIGGKDAILALTAVREAAPPAVRATILESLLQCAEILLAGGDSQGSTQLYRDLSTSKSPERIRLAAWRGLVLADAGQRADLMTKALAGQDYPLQVTALKLVRELNDVSVIQACLRQWTLLPAEAQLAVLEAHLKFGPEALSTVRTATQSSHMAVRVAAWQALGDLSDPSAIPGLATAAARGEAAERGAARDTLARLRGPGVREALLMSLAGSEPQEKAELLRALGERGDTQAANLLVQNAASGPELVRLAALESLRKIAGPQTITPLLDLAAKSKSDAECEPVLKALYAVCQASPDKDQTTSLVLGAMERFPAAERRRLLPLLAELGRPAALEAALAATRDPDPELVKEAVRVLSQWPNAAPAPRLLELARASADSTLHRLALRGCIEVLGQEPDGTKRLTGLQEAMAAARRPDEKKQALGQIGQLPTSEALKVVLVNLSEPALVNEAGLAAVAIAEKLAATQPKLAADAATRVLAQCKLPEIVKRAWALRGKAGGAGPFLRDWLVAGPYTQPGVIGAEGIFNVVFPPEKPGQPVQWKPMPRGDLANLASLFPEQGNCAAYLKTRVVAPADCDALLLLGSDDGVKAWINGVVVHSNNVDRGAVVDQDMAPIRLKKGANDLLLKISQGGGGWAAFARIVGSDGLPIAGLTSRTGVGQE